MIDQSSTDQSSTVNKKLSSDLDSTFFNFFNS